MRNLQITLKKSTWLISLYTLLYSLALIVLGFGLWQYWLNPFFAIFCFLFVLVNGYQTAPLLQIIQNKRTPTQLHWDLQTGWHVTRHQTRIPVKLCRDSVMTSWLLLLHFKSDSHFFRIPILITKDRFQADDFRRCRLVIHYLSDKSHSQQ